ncbi:MAG: ATP phosphoribosyltransferase regulatory subunit [Porticoccaceae bacterium]
MMTKVDRWLLPEGIEEILPDRAITVEHLRRRLLDTYHRWGYDLVIPPLMEFTDSLLSGSGRDLDQLTFKFTDQLSGKMLGVRADTTPQTARMDAHSLRRKGPNRLCYATTVLYTRPRRPAASRSPVQVGVELYGVPGLEADIEVISLLVEALEEVGVAGQCLDLGHVGIYRSIEEILELDESRKGELFELLQAKSCELAGWIERNIDDPALASMIAQLPGLHGDVDVLDRAREIFADGPAELELALDELQQVVAKVKERFPALRLFLDLCQLESYHYHTGIVFAIYADGARQALGNGGRYDDIGESFGRARPATGCSVDLKAIAELVGDSAKPALGIYAPPSDDPAQDAQVRSLRQSGERVVCGFSGETPDYSELGCDRILVTDGEGFSVKSILN